MQRRHDEHKRHVALWVAVGGTMAVIVALWVLILPMQLSDSRFLGLRDAARWNAAGSDAGDDPSPTFEEALAQQRRQLRAFEESISETKNDSVTKIQELRAKIEAASQKKEIAPPANINATP